jgi:hypothetical protein
MPARWASMWRHVHTGPDHQCRALHSRGPCMRRIKCRGSDKHMPAVTIKRSSKEIHSERSQRHEGGTAIHTASSSVSGAHENWAHGNAVTGPPLARQVTQVLQAPEKPAVGCPIGVTHTCCDASCIKTDAHCVENDAISVRCCTCSTPHETVCNQQQPAHTETAAEVRAPTGPLLFRPGCCNQPQATLREGSMKAASF